MGNQRPTKKNTTQKQKKNTNHNKFGSESKCSEREAIHLVSNVFSMFEIVAVY